MSDESNTASNTVNVRKMTAHFEALLKSNSLQKSKPIEKYIEVPILEKEPDNEKDNQDSNTNTDTINNTNNDTINNTNIDDIDLRTVNIMLTDIINDIIEINNWKK
jgi:hypothetical protein